MNKKSVMKIISVCTLVLLFSIVIFAYRQYDDYKTTEAKYTTIQQSIYDELNLFIQGILSENQKKAEINMSFYTNRIHESLLKEYGDDLKGLENDIANPSVDSKLTRILDRTLSDVYINEDSLSNKPLVASMNTILWNRTLGYNDNTIDWEGFKSKHYNKNLSENAIECLKNMNIEKYDFIFWEAIKNNNPNHIMVNNMYMDEIFKVYKKEGMQSLKSYELLIPVYITKDGDVFGTKDINSLGKQIKNYKIIVIQRMNVYDALNPYSDSIVFFESQIKELQDEIDANNRKRISMMVQAIICTVSVIIFSGFAQNKIIKN